MLGYPASYTIIVNQARVLAQGYLDQARLHKEAQQFEVALFFYDQAKVNFRYITTTRKQFPALSEIKDAFNRASTSQTADDEALRQRIAQVYFERAELLEKLGKEDKAQASYKKAQAWGHPGVATQSGRGSPVAVHPGKISPATAPSSPTPADVSLLEKNKLVDLLFTKTLETFQQCKVSSVWPSAFLVYAHDNPHVGVADAGTAKFLIHHLGELGVNLYSDQKPKGQQTQASFSTRADTARLDDILTSQLCLLPTAIGAIQPVDKVIVCGSQVLGHYLQWGEAGQHYQAYCAELKTAYGLAQQNVTQAEAEIRKVVNTYSKKADFHHVLTEMAFLKIRTDYLEQHGIIPVSLSADGYKNCLQDFIEATTVRIEDMARFASKPASGECVYKNQGRHLVFFKLLERLLAQHNAESLLSTFWTGYAGWIKRLNSEAAVPTASAYLPVWDGITQQAQQALKALQKKVDANELRTALARYASLDRLAIQRLSGPPLSMKDCYINLAVVEHERVRKAKKKPKEWEESEPKEEEVASSPFHRLPSVEAIESNQQKLVPLEQLFEPRKVNDEKTVTPKRILIRGRAGVGKTTLSKKIVYEYTQKGQWRNRFDYLLWIPLRTLKGKQSCDLVTLFHETYFQSRPQGVALAKTLAEQVNGPAKDKALFVLDGWDEIAQEWGEHEPMSGFIKQLLNQPVVLITSRPYVELKQTDPMDLELETVGFSPENVMAYLDNPAMMPVPQAQQIKQFIQATPFIQGLVNVPIQLDALCYSWDEIKRLQQAAPGAMTVTTLYQAMMNKLWRKDILRLGKREGVELLTASHINALSPSRIEKVVKTEQDFLSALAFQGLQNNQIEFQQSDLHALIEQLEAQGAALPFTLEANLKKLTFLHTDDAEESHCSYHFMHLTFQEFSAAKHFVQYWETEREITLRSPNSKQWKQTSPDAFVRQHKYNPHYEIFWWFVSGLLRGEALNRFFTLLESEPRDLFGVAHQHLIMNVLHEASRMPGIELAPAIRGRLEHGLGQWLRLEMLKTGEGTLASVSTFPKHVLLQCREELASMETAIEIGRARHYRHALPALTFDSSIAFTKGLYWGETCSTAEVFSKQSSLPALALDELIALMKDPYGGGLKGRPPPALGKPPSSASALIALTKDPSRCMKGRLAPALGKQSPLPSLALDDLITLMKDPDRDVKYRAAGLLSKQSSLPASALDALIALMKDPDRDVKYCAATALGKQSSLPSSALDALIALTMDPDSGVQHCAAAALGKQSSLPAPAVDALIALTTDPHREVKRSAAYALGQLSHLPASAVEALIALMKDPYWEVQRSAAEVLAKHRWRFYRLLPMLNNQQIALIYTECLLKQCFDQAGAFYIQEGSLYFYTTQGLQSIPFSDANQEVNFKQAIQQAQQAAGLPLAL